MLTKTMKSIGFISTAVILIIIGRAGRLKQIFIINNIILAC